MSLGVGGFVPTAGIASRSLSTDQPMMSRLVPACLLVLALGACNTAQPVGVMGSDPLSDCLVGAQSYASAWKCSRMNVASYNGDRNVYVANGDALLDQVNRGEVSDADAMDRLSNGFGGGKGGGGRR